MATPYFSPSTFKFLSQLALSNTRGWFEEHKSEYEQLVREPSLALIRDFAPRLRKISKHFVAVDKKVGGSLMRVQRDVRFSKDKSPYKTNIGIQFRHAVGKDVHAPGLYLHISPDECFLGSGIWHPEPAVLERIRARILEKPAAWKKAAHATSFRALYHLGGDSLKRPPRGVALEHPLVEDLMRKDHIASMPLTPKQVTSSQLLGVLETSFGMSKPYLKFLCSALELPS